MSKKSSVLFFVSCLILATHTFKAQSFPFFPSSSVEQMNQLLMADLSSFTQEKDDLVKALKELEQRKNEFNNVLEALLKELQNSVNNQRNTNLAPLQNASIKLDQLMESHQNFQQILDNSSLNSQGEIKNKLQNIGVILNRLTKVIQPLKNGVKSAEVKQIQEYLGFFPRRNINPQFYGIYGQTTQDEIVSFTKDNYNKLTVQIKQLNDEINKEFANLQKNQEVETLQQLEAKLNNLESENNQLKAEVSQLQSQPQNTALFFLAIALSILALLGVLLLILAQKKAQKKITPTKVYNLTNNDLTLIEEEMYEKIAQQFKEQMKLIEARFKVIEGSGNLPKNIPHFSPSTQGDPKLRMIATREQGINNLESETNPKIINPYDTLVHDYNISSEELIKKVIEVNPINQELTPTDDNTLPQEITFKKQQKGQYWLIKIDEFDYLIPKLNFLITKLSYQALQTLFECYSYKPGISTKIQLLKPARVAVIREQEEWEFIQKGIIQFV